MTVFFKGKTNIYRGFTNIKEHPWALIKWLVDDEEIKRVVWVHYRKTHFKLYFYISNVQRKFVFCKPVFFYFLYVFCVMLAILMCVNNLT